MDILEAEARRGRTVVATTHDLACAAQRFQRVVAINRTRHRARRPSPRPRSGVLLAHVRRPPARPRRAAGRPRRRPPPRRSRRSARPTTTRTPGAGARDGRSLFEPLTYEFFLRACWPRSRSWDGLRRGRQRTWSSRAWRSSATPCSHAAFPGVVAAYILGAPYCVGASDRRVRHRARDRLDHPAGAAPRRHDDRRPVRRDLRPRRLPVQHDPRLRRATCSASCSGNVLAISVGRPDRAALLLCASSWLSSPCSGRSSSTRPSTRSARPRPGLPVGALDYLFLGLIALTIVISLQAVGIILVVAMLVTPAATAQLVTVRFAR